MKPKVSAIVPTLGRSPWLRPCLEALRRDGRSAEIDFEDPDAILVVETVGQSAGLACWSRAQLRAFPMMRLD